MKRTKSTIRNDSITYIEYNSSWITFHTGLNNCHTVNVWLFSSPLHGVAEIIVAPDAHQLFSWFSEYAAYALLLWTFPRCLYWLMLNLSFHNFQNSQVAFVSKFLMQLLSLCSVCSWFIWAAITRDHEWAA